MTPDDISAFAAKLKAMSPDAKTQDVSEWALRTRIYRACQELDQLVDLMQSQSRDLSKMAQDAFDEANRKAEK